MAKEEKTIPSIGGAVAPINVDPSAVVVGDKPARPEDRLEFNEVVIPELAQPVKDKKGKK